MKRLFWGFQLIGLILNKNFEMRNALIFLMGTILADNYPPFTFYWYLWMALSIVGVIGLLMEISCWKAKHMEIYLKAKEEVLAAMDQKRLDTYKEKILNNENYSESVGDTTSTD